MKAKLKMVSPKSKEWQRWFISHQSYLKWHIGICGFLQYARYAWSIERKGKESYIPFLHSNTSILEAYFSLVRASKGDTPLKYAGMVGTLDTRHSVLALESNPMYEAESMTAGESPSKAIENVTKRTDEKRTKIVNAWLENMKVRKPRRVFNLSDRPYIFNGLSKGNRGTRQVMDAMILECRINYSELFWTDCDFVEYAKLSISTPSEPFFANMATLSRPEENSLNEACQFIFGKLLQECEGFGRKVGSVDRSFILVMYKIQICNERMAKFHSMLPKRIQAYGDRPIIFHQLLVDFIGFILQSEFIRALDSLFESTRAGNEACGTSMPQTINELIETNKKTDTASVSPEQEISLNDQKKEVQFFFGYGIGVAQNKFSRMEEMDREDFKAVEALLESMTCSKEGLLLSSENVCNCYPRIVHLKNV